MRVTEKVRYLNLAYKYLLQSDGSQTWVYIDLDQPEIIEWGPHLGALTAHTDTANRTAEHRWKLVLWWSMDGRTWQGPTDVFAAIQANGAVIQSDFNDKTKLGPKIKLSLACRTETGSNVERALVSLGVAFEFRT